MADSLPRLPAIDLLVDGSPLPQACARRLTSLRVHQQLSRPQVCELSFAGIDDDDAMALFRHGAELAVSLRPSGTVLFAGRVTAVESGWGADRIATLAVRAGDALVALRNRQRRRAFVGLDIAAIARELTADLGLSVACDDAGPAWPRVIQAGSDFELLAELAARRGLQFAVQDGELRLMTQQGRGDAIVLTLHDELHEVRFESNAHGASRRVDGAGWDPWLARAHAARADLPRGVDADAQAEDIGGAEPRLISGLALQGDDQARSVAQAELDRRRAQALVLWGTAVGDARLQPGACVRVKGVPSRLAGDQVLARVVHTIDADHGYVCEFTSELPAPAAPHEGTRMTLGIVSNLDDPERLGRIQVTLPAWGHVETDWLQIAAPGAGKAKGLIALPDVDDHVLVLLDRADLAQAVVLGSLYAEAGLPEHHAALGKDASFGFVTPGGHHLRLDDGTRTVRVGCRSGSWLEMAPDRVRLHAAAPMTIEAPGERLVFRARFIDFDRE